MIVNAKWIQYRGYQHVLSHETNVAVALDFWHGVVKGLLQCWLLYQLVDWVRNVDEDEGTDGNDQDPLGTLVEQYEETHVEVGVESRYLTHDRFDEMPLVKDQYLLVFDLFLDPDHKQYLKEPI